MAGALREHTSHPHWVTMLLHMLRPGQEDTALHHIVRFALGLAPDVLGFATWLEHSGDAVDLLYGLALVSTHSHPKLKFFNAPCAVCGVAGLATHVALPALTGHDTAAPLCGLCTGLFDA